MYDNEIEELLLWLALVDWWGVEPLILNKILNYYVLL